jgi:hypothetical protein
MKTNKVFIIISLLLTLSVSNMLGQPYKSIFGNDTTQWNVVYRVPDIFPNFIYSSFGDTTINGKNYKFIYKGYWYYFGDKYGYLREDTLTGKIWFLSLDRNEQLIMDLSLVKSDTFDFAIDTKYTVDTVFYKSGRKYISFNENSSDSILFIEGIGPFNFLFSPEVWNPSYAQIRCMFKDNELVYHNTAYLDCIDTFTSIDNTKINNFKAFPNPAINFITININNEKLNIIELYNSSGLKILEQSIKDKSPIYIGNIPSGLYFVRIRSKSEVFLSKLLKL